MPAKECATERNGTNNLCKRCNLEPPTILVRADPLCQNCFIKYINTKVIKRLEAFRVRHDTFGKPRSVLLALSLGPSSVTLLHVLSLHLSRQSLRTGHPSFSLKVLFVQEPLDTPYLWEETFEAVKKRFPEHSYFTVKAPDLIEVRDFVALADGSVDLEYEDDEEASQAHLLELIELLPSATSRADVLSILRTRVIVNEARKSDCTAIIWGDSTTRLAERTLSETAKGRGFSLPWQVNDGVSPQGVSFHYPMGDLLKKEIIAHVEVTDPPLSDIILKVQAAQQPASSKNTTIDDLMKQYFDSVEATYPSIVANVVRTSSKLETPLINERALLCNLCRMPVLDGPFGIHGWGGDQSSIAPSGNERLCYGCSRSVPQKSTAQR